MTDGNRQVGKKKTVVNLDEVGSHTTVGSVLKASG